MKLVTSLSILLLASSWAWSCELNKKYSYIALSAPISILLKELGVLSEVKSIGSFHPYREKIKKIDGGIFLRASELDLDLNTVLFYDSSKNLEKELKKFKFKAQKIVTRELSAIESTSYLLNKVSPYLRACEVQVTKLKSKIKAIGAKIKKTIFSKTFIFYTGSFSSSGKNNSLVIANDGFVLDLKENKSFSSYPSQLAYVNWSSKLLSKIDNKFLVGLSESSSHGISLEQISSNTVNIKYPGVLIPGYSQLKFLDYFIDKLTSKKLAKD